MLIRVSMRAVVASAWLLTVALGGQAASAAPAAVPIPSPGAPAAPAQIGHPAVPDPVRGIPPVPQNPFMASNGRSEIHLDAWQSDAYRWAGPLGRSPLTLSTLISRDCGSITFDSRGRLVSICIGPSGPELYMFDPRTLATLATLSLPGRTEDDLRLNPNIFQDFSSGGYFYLDDHDRIVTGTTDRRICVIAERARAPGFRLVRDYSLRSTLSPSEEIVSALPDQHGLLWFVARRDGVVGTLNFATGKVHVVRLGRGADGEITKSLATDQHGGVYIATNHELYRFDAGRGSAPRITWQIRYPNDGKRKPGELDAGTGTTPTVMPGGYVSIADDADPVDVVVYRTAARPSRQVRASGEVRRVGLPRRVCRVPVFARGASATENSLIGAGRSIIVENNYGYTGPASVSGGKVTAAGFARVDIDRGGMGCHRVWTTRAARAPSVVPKLSLANGLIYTYTKGSGKSDPWYWTAIDFRTGRIVFEQLAGSGAFDYNNNYAGIAISRGGTAYLGVLDGIVAMRDRR